MVFEQSSKGTIIFIRIIIVKREPTSGQQTENNLLAIKRFL